MEARKGFKCFTRKKIVSTECGANCVCLCLRSKVQKPCRRGRRAGNGTHPRTHAPSSTSDTQQYQRRTSTHSAAFTHPSHPTTHLDCVPGVVCGSAGALLGVSGVLTAVLQAGRLAGRQARGPDVRQHRLAQACNCTGGKKPGADTALAASSRQVELGSRSPGQFSCARWQGRSSTHLGGAHHGLLHIRGSALHSVLGLAGSIAAGAGARWGWGWGWGTCVRELEGQLPRSAGSWRPAAPPATRVAGDRCAGYPPLT